MHGVEQLGHVFKMANFYRCLPEYVEYPNGKRPIYPNPNGRWPIWRDVIVVVSRSFFACLGDCDELRCHRFLLRFNHDAWPDNRRK